MLTCTINQWKRFWDSGWGVEARTGPGPGRTWRKGTNMCFHMSPLNRNWAAKARWYVKQLRPDQGSGLWLEESSHSVLPVAPTWRKVTDANLMSSRGRQRASSAKLTQHVCFNFDLFMSPKFPGMKVNKCGANVSISWWLTTNKTWRCFHYFLCVNPHSHCLSATRVCSQVGCVLKLLLGIMGKICPTLVLKCPQFNSETCWLEIVIVGRIVAVDEVW